MRTAREASEGNIYHIIQRGTGRQLIFEDDEDRSLFLRLLRKSLETHSVETYCWCLMDNHFHLLLHGEIERISSAMRQCCGQYASLFNLRHDRIGHLFQDRFKSEPINSDAYLLTVVRYIHQNPEKAGFCLAKDWRWSSYREYAGSSMHKLCETEFVLECFGDKQSFINAHEIPCEQEECMDVFDRRSKTRGMTTEKSIVVAEKLLGSEGLSRLKSLDKSSRDNALTKLLNAGLTIRQIERLTGIGRGIIARVAKHSK